MLIFNKIILLQNLPTLYYTLRNAKVELQPFCFYGDRIAVQHKQIGLMHSLRFWRTKCLLNYWYETECGNKFIGALDYFIKQDHIKIDYVNINDRHNVCNYENRLTDAESNELMDSCVEYIKKVAQKEQKPKIILDVHHNLRIYNQYYKNRGFELTDRKSHDNRFWIETELAVPLI